MIQILMNEKLNHEQYNDYPALLIRYKGLITTPIILSDIDIFNDILNFFKKQKPKMDKYPNNKKALICDFTFDDDNEDKIIHFLLNNIYVNFSIKILLRNAGINPDVYNVYDRKEKLEKIMDNIDALHR